MNPLDALGLTLALPGWQLLLAATGLLAVALAVLFLEFFLASAGILLFVAGACGVGAITLAFMAGPTTGTVFIIIAPILALLVVRFGLIRLQESSLVPKTEITSATGMQDVADLLGIGVGSRGTLVTPARPSGKARFERGICDVQVQGQPADNGTPIEITAIEGPIVFVRAVT